MTQTVDSSFANTVVPVVCGIILSEGLVLVTKRGPEMSRPGKWEFPGGKLEPGETPEECLSREIAEELGITVRTVGKLTECTFAYEDLQIRLIPLVAEYISGVVTLHEHMQFTWAPATGLEKFDWAPADIPVVKEFIKLAHNYSC